MGKNHNKNGKAWGDGSDGKSSLARAPRVRPQSGYHRGAFLCTVALVWTIGLNGWLAWRFVSNDAAPGETAAVLEIRTLNTALSTFAYTYNMGFPDRLHRLRIPSANGAPTYNNAGLFRDTDHLSDSERDGRIFSRLDYEFTYTAGGGKFGSISSYTISARPVQNLDFNHRSFFADETGVIRWTLEPRAANRNDSPL